MITLKDRSPTETRVEVSSSVNLLSPWVHEELRVRRWRQRFALGLLALVVAIAARVIVSNMVNKEVYAAAGLDVDRAVKEAKNNAHHHTMMRTSSEHLMAFLLDCGLITKPAEMIYRRLHML